MIKNCANTLVLDPRGQPSGIYGRRLDPGSNPRFIHDPENQPREMADVFTDLKMAPRLDSLAGKTIYLVDTGFSGAKDFMEELQDFLAKHHPEIKTILRHKKNDMFTDEPELWKDIKENGDTAVIGVGG
jgi:hypothetical protein